jgi:hypothetical protein
MYYYLEDADIYLLIIVGMKTPDIDANPEIWLQVEEVHDSLHGRSGIVNDRADRLTEPQDINYAMQFIKEHHPTLSAAINRTGIDSWGRAEVVTIYRVQEGEMSGRTTEGVRS